MPVHWRDVPSYDYFNENYLSGNCNIKLIQNKAEHVNYKSQMSPEDFKKYNTLTILFKSNQTLQQT